MKRFLILWLMLAISGVAHADITAQVSPDATIKNQADGKKGWFFYKDPLQEKKEREARQQQQQAEQPKKLDDKCKKAATWTSACGFVDPGTDFNFQAKQRDALMQNMTMKPDDPKTVESFQRYNKWAVQQAVRAANTWYWNMTQHPDLDPSVSSPVSALGLDLATKIEDVNSKNMFKLLKDEGGMLIYFTRSDCVYCHSMEHSVQAVAKDSGLPIYDASLDNTCLPSFDKTHCLTQEQTLAPAEKLSVTTVPALFLYAEPNTWIRVATGVTDQETIKARMVNFFAAYRNAMLKGVNNGEGTTPSADFKPQDDVTLQHGSGNGVKANPDALPSEADIKAILMGH